MPGLAASSSIFEFIKLPETYVLHFLEWLIPERVESLDHYIKRLLKAIDNPNPVLIGVSFGGIIVQEMSKIIAVKKVIIISSVKSRQEFPNRLRLAQESSLYKLIPTGLFEDLDQLLRFAFTKTLEKKIKLYKRYMKVNDKIYLDWAIEQVLNWSRDEPDPKVIHIHGTNDPIFPIKNIKNCISIEEASHVLILTHAHILNKILPNIISND